MKKLIFFFERFEIYDVNVLCKHTVNLCNYSNYQPRLFGEKSQWWHTSHRLLASFTTLSKWNVQLLLCWLLFTTSEKSYWAG